MDHTPRPALIYMYPPAMATFRCTTPGRSTRGSRWRWSARLSPFHRRPHPDHRRLPPEEAQEALGLHRLRIARRRTETPAWRIDATRPGAYLILGQSLINNLLCPREGCPFRLYLVPQHPHPPHVIHLVQVFAPGWLPQLLNIFIAQIKFELTWHAPGSGQSSQWLELICHGPTSVVPSAFRLQAWASPLALSLLTMHSQCFWSQPVKPAGQLFRSGNWMRNRSSRVPSEHQ